MTKIKDRMTRFQNEFKIMTLYFHSIDNTIFIFLNLPLYIKIEISLQVK